MTFFALIIGIALIVAAMRNSQDALFSAIGTDVPNFIVWAAAIFALGAIGFVPGLKPVSRALLALVITVLIVTNYKKIIAGFENLWQHPPKTTTQNAEQIATQPQDVFQGLLDAFKAGGGSFGGGGASASY